MMTRLRTLATCLPLLWLAQASIAHADSRSDARAEYERGKRAHERRDYGEAARSFARADEILPSAVSLQAAIEEATRAEDAQLALALCERADRRADPTPELTRAVEQARARFPAPTTPTPPPPATPAAPVEPPAPIVPTTAPPTPTPTPAKAPAPVGDQKRHGLSPAWFWTGVGVSAALGVATIATGAATASTHASFEDERCAQRDAGRCSELASRGRTLQSVGLGLLAGTAVVSVGTVLVGALATDWSGKPRISIAPTRGGGYVSATVAF